LVQPFLIAERERTAILVAQMIGEDRAKMEHQLRSMLERMSEPLDAERADRARLMENLRALSSELLMVRRRLVQLEADTPYSQELASMMFDASHAVTSLRLEFEARCAFDSARIAYITEELEWLADASRLRE
jgi:Tfp pilus assembly protein PilO